jgi:hypothetical protein
MIIPSHFVHDGQERAWAALEPVVRAQVIAEYARRCQDAPFWRRWLLRLRMPSDIRRRLEQLAPSDALYWADPYAAKYLRRP